MQVAYSTRLRHCNPSMGEHMTERDIELVNKVAEMTPDVYNTKYDNGMKCIEFTEDALQKFSDLIRADERKHLEAALLKLKDGVAASSDYIQGRWDLIGEFQDVIRARGNT